MVLFIDYVIIGVIFDKQQPNFAIVKNDKLLLLELTVGFKTNIKKNFDYKAKRYRHLLAEL